MTLIIERVVASFLWLTGLSYLVQSLIWKDLVQELFKKKAWLMLLSLWFLPWGLLIVFGHNIWGANWQVIITVLGWFITLKCILYLLVPNWANFVNRFQVSFYNAIFRWPEEWIQF